MTLEVLYETIEKARTGSRMRRGLSRDQNFREVCECPDVRDAIGWDVPQVDDVSELIAASSGCVRAVRLDLLGAGVGHKHPVVGGLLVYHALRRHSHRTSVSRIIDGGNVSTGLALAHFARKFSVDASLVMSRFFPEDILSFLRQEGAGRLQTVIAPSKNCGREREFYAFLYDLVRNRRVSDGLLCLWHAKYGGRAVTPLGESLARNISDPPDVIVLSVGAGATLEGWALPLKRQFACDPRIVAVEHEACRLIELPNQRRSRIDLRLPDGLSTEWIRRPPPGIPHSVLGPHYDELNPLIASKILHGIDGVVRYSDEQWKQMATYCRSRGMSVGNSSAVNLLVSRALAELGLSVLTFIYEPCRPYYVNADVDFCEPGKTAETQKNHMVPTVASKMRLEMTMDTL
ncbi:MAG: PLP-dependent lyase/thiolase [Planctomycetes bacterium]|nr:PLP-dependent lyase/thiolase [Planctomycetota bacterium]